MFRKITHKLQEFRRKEDGNIALEAALYLPLLLGVFAATYTLFDLFRQETVNSKAAYTVSDLISRETAALNDDYIDSIYTLGRLMARAGSDMSMRVSVIRWDADDDRYYVDWSVERGDQMEIWTDANVTALNNKLPLMPDQERVIVVETWNDVEPAFRLKAIKINKHKIYNLIFTHPHFTSQITFKNSIINNNSIHNNNNNTNT